MLTVEDEGASEQLQSEASLQARFAYYYSGDTVASALSGTMIAAIWQKNVEVGTSTFAGRVKSVVDDTLSNTLNYTKTIRRALWVDLCN